MTDRERESTHIGTRANGRLTVLCRRRNERAFCPRKPSLKSCGSRLVHTGTLLRQLQGNLAEALRTQTREKAGENAMTPTLF